MISIICAFAAGVIIGITSTVLVQKIEYETQTKRRLKTAWSRVLPIYGIATVLLWVAIHYR